MHRGKFAFQNRLGQPYSWNEIQRFLCFTLYLREISKYKPPGGAYIQRGDLTKRFLRYELGGLIHEGAYFRNFTEFLHTYFVKCRRTLLNLNSKEPYPSSEREIKFRRCLFTFSIKRENWHFHVVVLQKRQRNVQKVCCTFQVSLHVTYEY